MGKKADKLVDDLLKHCEELRRQKAECEQLREQVDITIHHYEYEIRELERIIKRRGQDGKMGNGNECVERRQADTGCRADNYDRCGELFYLHR